MTQFLGTPKVQFFDSNGDPLTGGKLFIYEPGTTTKKDSFPTIADAKAGTSANANPVILDSRGEASVVLAGKSKLVLTTSADTDPPTAAIWTEDNVSDTDILDNNGNELIEFTTTASAVNHLSISNAATGSSVTIDTIGDDATPNLVIQADGGDGTVTINGLDISSATFSTPLTVEASSGAAAELRLSEDSDNGSNYLSLKAASDMAANYTITAPDAAPTTNDSVLKVNTDGSSAWDALDLDANVNPNILVNPAFQIWQRSSSINSGSTYPNNDDIYSADQWILLSDGNNIVNVIKDSSTIADGSVYSMQFDVQTATKKFGVLQILENANCGGLAGQVVSVSLEARTAAAKALDNIRIGIVQWTGQADAPTSDCVATWESVDVDPTLGTSWSYANTPANHALTSSFQRFTVEDVTLSSGLNNLGIFIWSNDTTNSAVDDRLYIAKVKVEANNSATAWQEPNIADEYIKCMRYLEIHGGDDYPRLVGTAHTGGTLAMACINFAVPKLKTPSVSIVGTWTATASTQPSISASSVIGYQLTCSSTNASGSFAIAAPTEVTTGVLATAEL